MRSAAGSVTLFLVFFLAASAIALIRLRTSPLYPSANMINSDIYVYQVVGNSWARGLWPYRDVYDVKGPSFYLLFGLFALARPWSMGPPLAALTVLAFASLWLSYAIARFHIPRRDLAAVCALMSCAIIYLGVSSVVSSFTCEELSIPGVLLLLWLVSRWLGRDEPVADRWWLLSGFVLGALFWAKYQVIAPWGAILVAVTAAVVLGARPTPRLRRVVLVQLAGLAAATAVVLILYAQVLPDMLRAYFWAKRGNVVLGRELPAEAQFVLSVVAGNTAAALVLLAVLALFIGAAFRRSEPLTLVLTIAFVLSLWASTAFVRHANNLFVPLSFVAATLPQVVAFLCSRRKPGEVGAFAVPVVLTLAVCAFPTGQSVLSDGLLRSPKPVNCYAPPSRERIVRYTGVATAFARTAGDQPILSMGNLSAAQSMYVSHLPMRRPYEFVDASWAISTGADRVQTGYLQDRVFSWVWIRVPGLRRFDDLEPQIAAATYTHGRLSQPQQVAALLHEYVPVLTCNNEILMRVR